ncbi:MAG: hypothetical protein IJF92_02220 [Bacilli bacterium]|nr:hypothetical protein [Bacilli bacterium]
MKDSDIKEIMNDLELEELEKFKNDPEWFKKTIAKACFIDEATGLPCHIRLKYLYQKVEDETEDFEVPIVTTLSHIRPIVVDPDCVYDGQEEYNEQHINKNSCIVLVPDKDDYMSYIEPISDTKVKLLHPDDIKEDFFQPLENDQLKDILTFECIRTLDDIPPFGFVNKELFEKWKKETLPYKKELKEYLKKLKEKTNNNVGKSDISDKEIMDAVKGQKK